MIEGIFLGFGLGAAAMWWHFAHSRLIRSKHEWYSDPIIAGRYPEEASRALSQPDTF